MFPPGIHFGNLQPFMSPYDRFKLTPPKAAAERFVKLLRKFQNSDAAEEWSRTRLAAPVVGALLEVNSDLWQTHRRQRCSDKEIRIQIRPEVNEDGRKQ